MLASNMNYATASVDLKGLGLPPASGLTQVLDSGAKINALKTGFTFESVGSGAFILAM